MAYRFERGEPIPIAVRRIATEEIDGALADLERPDHDAAVHSLRKRFKRLRALMRLVRGHFEGADVQIGLLRAAGHTLSHARDRRVAWDTASRLAERDDHPAMSRLSTRLSAPAPEGSAPPAALAALLSDLRAEITAWSPTEPMDSPEALAPSLRRTYSQGRRRYAEARMWPTPAHVHAWRKRAKDLWYHATLLSPVSPAAARLVDDLDALGDTLGLEHDHAMLDERIDDPLVCSDEDRPDVRAALLAERARLQQIAWPLGHAIYAREPDAFVADVLGGA